MNNKTNIEEDIKILKNFLQTMKSDFRTGLGYEDELQAIENILADRERLQEENRALREDYQTDNQYYEELIKDKIEELKKSIKTYEENEKDIGFKDFWHNELLKATHKLWALQELVEEE